MKILKEKIEVGAREFFRKNEDDYFSHGVDAAECFIEGANFAIPLAKEEGFRRAIEIFSDVTGKIPFADLYFKGGKPKEYFEQEGIRLGILSLDSGDKK